MIIEIEAKDGADSELISVTLPQARDLYAQLADLFSADVSPHIWPTYAGPNTTHVWSADE